MGFKRPTLLLTANLVAATVMAMPGNPALMFDRAFVVVQEIEGSTSILNSLDLKNGDLTPVGDIGFQTAALAFSNTGELFAVDPGLDVLVRIDPSQGVGVAVGHLGIDIVDLPGCDLTFDDDNNLWMMATAGDVRGLYSVDHDTGQAELVAPIPTPFARALAADGGGIYAADYSLGIIDPADGTVYAIEGDGLSFFQPQWMSFGSGSTLWAVAVCGVCASPWEVIDLVNVDPETGVVSLRGAGWLWTSGKVRGLAIQSYRRSQQEAPTFFD